MVKIQKIGGYHPLDKEGYIINPCKMDLIQSEWFNPIEEIKNIYIDNLGDSLISIYLRGSTALGNAIPFISDIDTFAIIKSRNEKFYWNVPEWINTSKISIINKYNFISDIEMSIDTLDNEFYKTHWEQAIIIKTQSLCIYGKDISEYIPKYKPNRNVMLHYYWISRKISKVRRLIKKNIYNNNAKELQTSYKALLKLLIRTCFELVMEKENKFTNDLYFCYKSFAKYYPDKGNDLLISINHFLSSPKENTTIISFLDSFCLWVQDEVERILVSPKINNTRD